MEQLEAGVSTLIDVCRRLKDENEKLTLQMEGLIQESESLLVNEKESIKNKLERLSTLERENKNNENTKKQIGARRVLKTKSDAFAFTFPILFFLKK